MADAKRRSIVLPLSEFPNHITINASHGIVGSHARITIKPMTVIQVNVKGGHNDPDNPEGYMSTILEPDVNQAEYRGEKVKPIECHGLSETECDTAHSRETRHWDEANLIIAVVVRMTAAFVDSRINPSAGCIVFVEHVVQVYTEDNLFESLLGLQRIAEADIRR